VGAWNEPETYLSASSGTTALKEHFLATLAREHLKTLRVLKAYPEDKRNLKPSERSMSTLELVQILVTGQEMLVAALTTGFDWSGAPRARAVIPASMASGIRKLDEVHADLVSILKEFPPARLGDTIQFFVGPKTLGDVPIFDFLWQMLLDQIHHRGQLSIYMRIAGAKVPSIYGPSGDEPWM
jgi:uncharacterized damage-inducible protein DinB